MVTTIVPPTFQPIPLSQAKDHLNIFHNYKDEDIASKLQQAIAYVENYCNHYLAERTIRKEYNGFGNYLELLPGPVSEVVKVEYYDAYNNLIELNSSEYIFKTAGMRFLIFPKYSWPANVTNKQGSVRVTFKAGYDDAIKIPAELKAGVFIILSNLYENMGDEIIGRSVNRLTRGFENIVSSQILSNK